MKFKVSDMRNRKRTRIGFHAAHQGRRELEHSWDRDKFGQYPPRETTTSSAHTRSLNDDQQPALRAG
jgi:hypothetical protein